MVEEYPCGPYTCSSDIPRNKEMAFETRDGSTFEIE